MLLGRNWHHCSMPKALERGASLKKGGGIARLVRALLSAEGIFQSYSWQACLHQRSNSQACLNCGLIWNELDTGALKKNIHTFGLLPHNTGVMRVVREDGDARANS